MRTFEQRRFHDHPVEPCRVRAPEAGSVRVVRKTEDRGLGIALCDIRRVDARNVGDHEIGWLDTVGGLEVMLREERLELAPEEEVDPCEQDRCHA
jgi:hypothetical protein